jgi:nicotinate-nucleotide--dimethylbenzimidazole phosphoribosyltransferase
MQLFTFAGDHGVTRQKITPFPSEVTGQMVYNMLGGGAAVSVMCRKAGIGYAVVDMGVATDFPDHEMLVSRKVACGTADFSQGPAMTDDECAQAIRAGIALAATSPADLFGCGEMGIGNSASASALYALLLSIDGKETTGAGTGATGELLAHKKKVVAEAVSLHRSQWDRSPFDALRRCGGYEIAGITGLLIGAASRRIPVVIDGFICSAAALVAIRMCPQVGGYLFFSHVSEEQFHRTFLAGEKAFPLLDLGMRLGEGTGAVLAMQIIGQALACYHEMATFSSASVSNKAGV